jgi:hypothetical protein
MSLELQVKSTKLGKSDRFIEPLNFGELVPQ